MRERINKPRVFLSHARKDVYFIEKLENDLRKCQIDTWRDQNEIQDGQPWMDAIFEDGIPTCDAILAYFTENSLNSPMVAKEVDSAILRRLKDSKIAFLPYVGEELIRTKLRIDIQTLHCREWNEKNYSEILPSIVAQIWRSYLERSISNAISVERNARLEAELELEKLRKESNSSAFYPQEETEFQHIYERFQDPMTASRCINEVVNGNVEIEAGQVVIKYSFIELLKSNIDTGRSYYEPERFLKELESEILKLIPSEPTSTLGPLREMKNLVPTLVIFGLVEQIPSTLGQISYKYSEKMYRFISWLDFHNKFQEQAKPEFLVSSNQDIE